MKQALASSLIITQQKIISNPPTFVKITKKYQRRASTPALSNTSSLTNSVSGVAGRAGSPEVSSSNQSGGSASGSAGSLGVQDFMNPEILKTAKLWRFQKLSRGELVGLVQHYTGVTPSVTATKAHFIKSLMMLLLGCSEMCGFSVIPVPGNSCSLFSHVMHGIEGCPEQTCVTIGSLILLSVADHFVSHHLHAGHNHVVSSSKCSKQNTTSALNKHEGRHLS